LTAARADKLAPKAAQMRLAALMRVPIKIDKQPAFEVCTTLLLWLQLASLLQMQPAATRFVLSAAAHDHQ
jgi:hypothetical protein